MNPTEEHKLNYNREIIVDDVDSRQVVNHLIAQGVLDVDDDEDIRAEKTRKKRTELLLDKLTDGGPDAFKHFRNALTDRYQHIVIKLDATPMGAASVKDAQVKMKYFENDRKTSSSCKITGNKNFVVMASQGAQVNFSGERHPQDYMW